MARVANTPVNGSGQPAVTASTEETSLGVIQEFDINESRRKAKVWGTSQDGSVYYGVSNVADTMEPGLYKTGQNNDLGYFFQKIILSSDDLITLPEMACNDIILEIKEFWTDKIKKRHKARGLAYKRGILMYGEPGSGKTASIVQLIRILIEDHSGVAVFATNPHILTGCLQLLRHREPERPVICIMEDFETLTRKGDEENEWLAILNGESQIENVVFLATTNYIKDVDKRFTDRPSRFDVVVPVDMPSPRARAAYLACKETNLEDDLPDMTSDEIARWVELSDGYSMAHLKEMIISGRVYEKPVEEVTKRLNEMRERNFDVEKQTREAQGKGGFGFIKEGEYDPNRLPTGEDVAKWIKEWKENGIVNV